METKKMIVGLLLIAAFALPAFATFEKDLITPDALAAVLEVKASESNNWLESAVLKGATFDKGVVSDHFVKTIADSRTIVSKAVLEEALLKNSNIDDGNFQCGESCGMITTYCFTSVIGCSCKGRVCVR